jgi:hypothetical protein
MPVEKGGRSLLPNIRPFRHKVIQTDVHQSPTGGGEGVVQVIVFNDIVNSDKPSALACTDGRLGRKRGQSGDQFVTG